MNNEKTLHYAPSRQEESPKRELHSQHPLDYDSGEAVDKTNEDMEREDIETIYGQAIPTSTNHIQSPIRKQERYVAPAAGPTNTVEQMIAKVGRQNESEEWQRLRARWGDEFMNNLCCMMVKVAVDESAKGR